MDGEVWGHLLQLDGAISVLCRPNYRELSPVADILGSASYNILDTDYDRYALLCTCQSQSILSLITFHRRSCTILMREPIFDPTISQQVTSILQRGGTKLFLSQLVLNRSNQIAKSAPLE